MKKILLLVAIAATLGSCKKENAQPLPQTAAVKFYTTYAGAAVNVITVNVQGINYGRLRYSAQVPSCTDGLFVAIALHPGAYVAHYTDASKPGPGKDISFTVAAGGSCQFFNLQ